MNFFGKKEKSNSQEDNSEITEKVERELIVHNMPRQEKFFGEIINPHSAGRISTDDNHYGAKKDFKIIGFLIIFFGIIIIGFIIFLTYRYVIAPTAKPTTNIKEVEKEVIIEAPKEVELTSPEDSIDIPDEYSDIDPVVVVEDVQNENNELMQEEFPGVDVQELPPLIDSDIDGLFDEEELILGTSVFTKDSDGDSYNDLEEIENNYNPTGTGVLSDSLFIKKYQNDIYNFEFLYPSSWDINSAGDNLIVFEVEDGSLMQLSITDNYDSVSILNWYQNNFPEETIVYDKLISKPGYEGVVSQNGLNVYLTKEDRKNIFIFSYIPASPERLSLINIFQMIYSSFKY